MKNSNHKLVKVHNIKFLFATIFICWICGFYFSTNSTAQTSESGYDIEIIGKPEIKQDGSELNDTLGLKFNLYKNKNTKQEERGLFIGTNDEIEVIASEIFSKSEKIAQPPIYIEGSLKNLKRGTAEKGDIPSDITISLLVDRSGSIDTEEMRKIRVAVKAFVNNVPDGCLYFSWFHDDISTSVPLTKDNFDDAKLETSNKNTALYNAIYTKLLEFDNTSVLPNLNFEPELSRNQGMANRNSVNNYLIVLTDGVNDVGEIPKYKEPNIEEISLPRLLKTIDNYKNTVKVYTLGFGEDSNDFDEKDLQRICMASGNPNGYFLAKPDSIFELFKTKLTNELTPDYEIKFLNPKGKTNGGEKRTLTLEINATGPNIEKATGSVIYGRCSNTYPCVVGKESLWGILLIGLITGVVFLLVMMIIIQLIIPLIKNKIFDIKYVKKHKPAKNEIRKECPYCGDPFNAGEQVVVKCKHMVHKVCWGDYDHVCPEYGQNCNEGKQNYFDISDPFSKKNKIYYLKWVLYGLISGFLTWTLYLMLKDWKFIQSISLKTVGWISPNITETDTIDLFVAKISSLLLIGTLLGLFLTAFFAYVEEYRQKSLTVFGEILLRGLIGGLSGFVSFFLGSIVLILLNQPFTAFLFDWIPWVIFGAGIGFILSIKTTIVWKHGVIGGLVSIIFCFIVLYFMVGDLGYPALLVGFMIYGAGLGFSIATVRASAEQYFLKIIQGKKHEEIIPVHKWMSFQGGHNEVYIGRGYSCEIQMNWEENNREIAERHAKLFINTNRNIPVIVSLEEGTETIYDDRIIMDAGKEYDLFNGNTFKIGGTVFQYKEKD